jgi:hypothetical protein
MGIKVVEAIVIFIITIGVLYITEVTWGTVMDQMLFAFMGLSVGADPTITGPILQQFGFMHKIMILIVVAYGVWVIRISMFDLSYTRNQ